MFGKALKIKRVNNGLFPMKKVDKDAVGRLNLGFRKI